MPDEAVHRRGDRGGVERSRRPTPPDGAPPPRRFGEGERLPRRLVHRDAIMKRMDSEEENEAKTSQIDLASLFPGKGDARRPPEWFGRGLLYAAIAVFVSIWVWNAWDSVKPVVLIVVISVFLALAMEPIVIRLVRHGWRRGAASGVTLVGVLIVTVALLVVFGKMFVDQLIAMLNSLPETYSTLQQWVSDRFNMKIPDMNNLGATVLDWVNTHNMADYAGQAWAYVVSLVGGIFTIFTVLLVTYYISACGPKMRKSICKYVSPHSQRRFLVTWTVLQDQISNFLYSRIILAAISSACMSVFLVKIDAPYWLPLSLFCGLASQFVPTIGTYIGGAIPVLSTWATLGTKYAVIVIVYICVYQQIENLLLSPKISQRTMDLNPAVAFLVVVLFGYLFGALGAFLALPVWASIQVLFRMYTKQYDLVDSPLLNDAKPVRKSAMVMGAETIGEHVIKPVADRLPRAVRGSTNHVTVEDEYQQMLRDEFDAAGFNQNDSDTDRDASETVAIPQAMPAAGAADSAAGAAGANGADDAAPGYDSYDSLDAGAFDTDVTEALRRRNEQGPAPEKSKFRREASDVASRYDGDDAGSADAGAEGSDAQDVDGRAPAATSDDSPAAPHRSSDSHPKPATPRRHRGHNARKEWR